MSAHIARLYSRATSHHDALRRLGSWTAEADYLMSSLLSRPGLECCHDLNPGFESSIHAIESCQVFCDFTVLRLVYCESISRLVLLRPVVVVVGVVVATFVGIIK